LREDGDAKRQRERRSRDLRKDAVTQSHNREGGRGGASATARRDGDAKHQRARWSGDLSAATTVNKEAECSGAEGGPDRRRETRSRSSRVDIVGGDIAIGFILWEE